MLGSRVTTAGKLLLCRRTVPHIPFSRLPLFFVVMGFVVQTLRAAELDHCRQNFIVGRYAECVEQAEQAIARRAYGEGWRVLKARAELQLGRYADAKSTIEAGLRRYPWSIRLRLVGHRVYLATGHEEEARKLLLESDKLASRSPWRYTDADELVALGNSALLLGADAREVLEAFFDRACQRHPDHRAPYLAVGELALEKHDFELAAETFGAALGRFPDDPDVHFGIARALAGSSPQRSAAALKRCQELNPRHVPALLFKADRLIDSEEYTEAASTLDRILAVNPSEPSAWAYRAVLAHLANDPKGEDAFRERAQGKWKRNPAVDHLIGKKLSQKYRFSKGAAYQQLALKHDKSFLPARVQLSQDLLRLGREWEGWRLADGVHASDAYEVTTFNLLELRDKLSRFRTLENEDFVVRMEAHEADVYGRRVLDLLQRAKSALCRKYGLELEKQITVEIFPKPSDFSVRTFGMPAVSGYLGVCFGKVITANSPASQGGHPSNWEAVLWHEFCHVITLELTRNRMPRWLSEGISVYEERQANANWGQRINPQYRELILGGNLTPIGELSGAFLVPESPLHLQFAYFESALVVEFLIERYGFEALKAILGDLGAGLPINVALVRHTDLMPKLEKEFGEFARRRAQSLSPEVDWTRPDLAALLEDDGNALSAWLAQHPNNFAALTAHAKSLIASSAWNKAKQPLRRLLRLCPEYVGSDNAYQMLALVHRRLEESNDERRVLEKYANRSADALSAYLRLLELQRQQEDWPGLRRNAERALAVNPLIAPPYRAMAEAAERLDDADDAMAAYRALLTLDVSDRAHVHFRLARLLHDAGHAQAKRHVLLALEEAPRFRAAHALLLEIRRE